MEYSQFASIAGVRPPGFLTGYRLRGRGHYPSYRVRCARLFVVTAEPGIPDLGPGLCAMARRSWLGIPHLSRKEGAVASGKISVNRNFVVPDGGRSAGRRPSRKLKIGCAIAAHLQKRGYELF
jgi:hypothetical protein